MSKNSQNESRRRQIWDMKTCSNDIFFKKKTKMTNPNEEKLNKTKKTTVCRD